MNVLHQVKNETDQLTSVSRCHARDVYASKCTLNFVVACYTLMNEGDRRVIMEKQID